MSGLKSQIGHAQGACGSASLAATLIAMEHGQIPPTINLDVPDPECDLDYVPDAGRRLADRTRPLQLCGVWIEEFRAACCARSPEARILQATAWAATEFLPLSFTEYMTRSASRIISSTDSGGVRS